jgi:hypothetical protein
MQPRPFLGAAFGTPDATALAAIHDGIVNVSSDEDPTMNYVTPFDSTQSFLWYKVTATEDALSSSCTNPAFAGCGLAMPYQGAPLTPMQLAVIQGWIDEGAPLN